MTPRDTTITNQLLQKAFVKIPYTFSEENMVLTGIESSYGVNNNSEKVTYRLWSVDSSGSSTVLLQWDHAGGNKFASSISNSIASEAWNGTYLYITGSNSSYDGVGFTVTVIFTNSLCMS